MKLCAIILSSCVVLCNAAYPPVNYGAPHPPSYQTYDRRVIDAYNTAGTTHAYEDIQSLYTPKKQYDSYSSKNTYAPVSDYGRSTYGGGNSRTGLSYGSSYDRESSRFGKSPSNGISRYTESAYGESNSFNKPPSHHSGPAPYGVSVGYGSYGKSSEYGDTHGYGGTSNSYGALPGGYSSSTGGYSGVSSGYGGYQTRNTYNPSYSEPSPYQIKSPSSYTTYSAKNDYGKTQAISYVADPYATPDPCNSLAEGDYSLQADFLKLFPGVDNQCNFIKCANYKAYVNPCSMGTKNTDAGGAHPKYGFCANLDHDHYCGHYASPSEDLGDYH